MKTRKRSIKEKILFMVLSVSLLSLVVIILTAVFGMINMRDHIIQSNSNLGQTAARDSQDALETQTVTQLSEISKSKAEISDEKLGRLEKYVQFMTTQCVNIYSNPEEYIPLTVDSLLSSGKGVLVPHLLYSDDTTLESIAGELGLVSNTTDILYSIVENDSDVMAAYVGTESGFIVLADREPGNSIRTLDPRKRTWYMLAKEKKSLIWTDIYDDALGRGLTITCAAPFYDAAGNFKGVVAIDSLLTTLNDIIIGTKIGATGFAFVLNEKGDMIISPTIEKSGDTIVRENFLESNNIILKAAAEKMIARKSGVARLVYNGRDVFFAYSPMQNLPWSIATMIDVSEVIQPALQSKASIITLASQAIGEVNKNIMTVSIFFGAVAILSAAVIIILSFLLSGRITKPIAYLTGKVSKVVEGDFDVEIDVKTGDEIEELADAFGNMTVEIKKYITNLAVETATKERMNSELALAAQIQSGMLPTRFPAFPDRKEFDIYASMHMAKVVGGDFYDYFLIGDDRLAFVMADVSGKGIPAALFMMVSKNIIKNNALAGLEIGDILYRANNSLCENNESNMFVTLFLGIIDLKSGLLSYANAGHNPPLVQRAGSNYDWLPVNSGFVLGGMENISFKPKELQLSKGDRIFCYTDGVTEAMNEKDELYSDERLIKTLDEKKDLSGLQDLIRAIKADVDIFANGAEQADDITILVVELKQI